MAKAHAVTQAESSRFARHGGRLDEARARYPHAPAPWIDLSTGINPRAWTPPPVPLDAGPLPDRTALRSLEHAAAAFFGCSPARVAAVPGSEIALRLLPMLGLPHPLTALMPGYGTHIDVADAVVPRGDGHSGAGTLLLANPNNPDGRVRSSADLLALVGRARATGGALVIDEAFADADPTITMVPMLDDGANVTVLRSFGKFFGLAGVRLGFMVGRPDTIARARMMLGDWPVSTQAILWGTAAYRDAGWIAHTRTWLADQASRLDRVLARHGLRGSGACPLFRLVEHADALRIFDLLARAAILTRPFAAQPEWLRFGLPADDAALDRLDRALARG